MLMSDFDAEIREFTLQRLRLIRDSRGTWPFAASLRRLGGQTAHEYEDRFLLELLQNAYDAQPPGTCEGRVRFLLRRQENTAVLYVANTGRAFRRKDFEALSNLALSSKSPGEGIGNKGLGFRSVLRVSEWPEVYSSHPDDGGGRLGYCFGFARPEDLARLAADPAEQAQLEKDVPPSALPIPRSVNDTWVSRLLELGFVTVVRLPLTRQGSVDLALARLHEFLEREVPPLLFLDRLRSVEISFDGVDEQDFKLTRATSPGFAAMPEGGRSTIVDTGGARYVMFERGIDSDSMVEQIERSIEAGDLSEEWRGWEGAAVIGLAVPLDRVVEGRLYTYLPMSSASPINGHMNAPFYTKLARLDANLKVGLNDFLMNELALLAASTADRLVGQTNLTWRRVAVDLVSWSGEHGKRFKDAAKAASGVPKVPTVIGSKTDWSPLSEVIRWPEEVGERFFSPAAVSQAGAPAVLDPAVGQERIEALQQSAAAIWGYTLSPSKAQAGVIAEHLAARVFKKRNPKQWNEFYQELAALARTFGADVLERRAVLVDQSGKLRRCGPWDERNPAEKPVFLPPVTADGGAAESAGPIQLPASLAPAVPMLHSKVELLRQEGPRRVRTEISELLREADLIREYKKEHVLRALAEASVRAKSDSRRTEILEHLFRVFAASPRGDGFDEVDPMVPSRERWILASEAVFGEGWRATMGPSTASIVGSVNDTRLKALAGRLLLPPAAWPFRVDHQELLTEFLDRIGVTDGLKPNLVDVEPIRENGEFWSPTHVADRLSVPQEAKAAWIRAESRNVTRPNHPYTPYRSDELWDLPGHLELQQHPSAQRMTYARLIAESLGRWEVKTLEFTFRRYKAIHRTSPDPQRWPSLAAALLTEVPWLPVTGPGHREEAEFVRPRDAWHFDDPERRPPAFATLVERSIATTLDKFPPCRDRLTKLGLRLWSDAEAAHDRLETLAAIVRQGEGRESDVDALKKAIREAFNDCLENGLLHGDSPIVVQRAHQLEVAVPGEVVYLPTDPPGFVDHLLESLDLPVAVVGSADPATIITHAPGLAERLRPGTTLTVEVVAAGEVVTPGTEHPLLLERAPWLVEWLLLTSELSRNKFLRLGSRALDDMVDILRRVRLIRAAGVHVRVNGRQVGLPPHLSGCVPLHDGAAPTLVVRAADFGAGEDVLDWTVVADAADSLAELLNQPRMASELRLSATEVRRVVPIEFRRPLPSEWAAALRSPEQRVREILARAHAHTEGIRELLVPAVLVCAGAEAAAELRAAEVPTLEDLEAELVQHVGSDRASHMMAEAQRAGSITAFRDVLGIEFEAFNLALEALGPPYEPIHDIDEHRRVSQIILARTRPQLAEALRVRYLPVFDARGDLQPYIELKRGPDLEPRREDLQRYASPPEAMLLSRIAAWLSTRGCPPLGEAAQSLPSIGDVRSRNLDVARAFLNDVSPVIAAWLTKNRSPLGMPTMGGVQDGTTALDAGGWLDFRLLNPNALPDLLHRVRHWPLEMPRSRNLEALGLTIEDVEKASEAQAKDKRVRRHRQSTISVASEEVDAEDLAAVAEAVRRTVDDRILKASKRQRSPAAPPAPNRGRRGSRRGPYRPTGGGMTDAQRHAIGLAGEVIAFQWLKAQYEEANDECWVSGYRSVQLGGEGDDACGYDFIVHQRSQSIRFDAKATAGNETTFELTENEIRVAQSATTRNPYRIIFIRNVLDPELRSLDVLPNPFGQEGAHHFRMTGRGVQFAFNL
jgi:hypothetical protein